MMKKIWERIKCNRGVGNLVSFMWIMVLILAILYTFTPNLLYSAQSNKLENIKNHALQEVTSVGYLSPEIEANVISRLEKINMPVVYVQGIRYPDFSGSTVTPVYRDDVNPEVRLVIKYPEPSYRTLLNFLVGQPAASPYAGFYYKEGTGRSENL